MIIAVPWASSAPLFRLPSVISIWLFAPSWSELSCGRDETGWDVAAPSLTLPLGRGEDLAFLAD
jgi:hypothetical protein